MMVMMVMTIMMVMMGEVLRNRAEPHLPAHGVELPQAEEALPLALHHVRLQLRLLLLPVLLHRKAGLPAGHWPPPALHGLGRLGTHHPYLSSSFISISISSLGQEVVEQDMVSKCKKQYTAIPTLYLRQILIN